MYIILDRCRPAAAGLGVAVEPAGQLIEQLQVAEVQTGYFAAMR